MDNKKLKQLISSAPSAPGLYHFIRPKKQRLYIGKAVNIKARLKNYLVTGDQRIKRMISEAEDVKFQETQTEIEALILESKEIKDHRPPFNIVMRDDKQYFFVVFTDDEFPKIKLTHQPVGSDAIGPFTDGAALKATLKYLRRTFPYCTCKQAHSNFCLNYHIDNCPGFCCLKKPKSEIPNYELRNYYKNIKIIREIFEGKRKTIVKNLIKEMKRLGKENRFEEAIDIQNKINRIETIFENASAINRIRISEERDESVNKALLNLKKSLHLNSVPMRIEGYDISNIQGKNAVGSMVVFKNGQPNKDEYRKFKIKNQSVIRNPKSCIFSNGGDTGIPKEILTRRFNHPEWKMPDLILVDGGKAQLSAALSATRDKGQETCIIALTKDDKRRGLKIFTDFRKEATLLSELSRDERNLILNIDAEAHRFAIKYYREVHRKKALRP